LIFILTIGLISSTKKAQALPFQAANIFFNELDKVGDILDKVTLPDRKAFNTWCEAINDIIISSNIFEEQRTNTSAQTRLMNTIMNSSAYSFEEKLEAFLKIQIFTYSLLILEKARTLKHDQIPPAFSENWQRPALQFPLIISKLMSNDYEFACKLARIKHELSQRYGSIIHALVNLIMNNRTIWIKTHSGFYDVWINRLKFALRNRPSNSKPIMNLNRDGQSPLHLALINHFVKAHHTQPL